METFSVLLAFYAGNSSIIGEFPSQGPVTRRHHRTHYDVIVMNNHDSDLVLPAYSNFSTNVIEMHETVRFTWNTTGNDLLYQLKLHYFYCYTFY